MKSLFKLLLLALTALVLISCGDEGDSDGPGLLSFSDDQDEAVKHVEEANDELKRIRILYRENNAKVEELKKALGVKDLARVKRLADDLLLVIADGYAFAEVAMEKLTDAQRLDINSDFKYYLSLKEDSLRLQIKAFEFRRQSARLFRDKFGTNDPNAMAEAAKKFKENEANFEKTMAEAKKVSEEADKLYKEANNKK
jgi:hypothetical protein